MTVTGTQAPGPRTDVPATPGTAADGATGELKLVLAEACRVIARAGLAEDILGHVSARTPGGDAVLVRSRSPQERGLLFTTPADIHEVGDKDDTLPLGYRAPNEFPIHSQVLKARRDVNSVVHAHAPSVVACDLAGLELRPIVGAYNIPAMRMASEGIPLYPRSLLINNDELGAAVAATLGDRPACVLRGHGVVTVGETVEQAVVRALNLEILARMTLDANRPGTVPPEVPEEDMSAMPDLGSTFNDMYVWQYQRAQLELAGLGLRR
ncbi:class II aldolase/adducin family protein [Streptomyces griseicoloratus]|uniref:class II aldolase/adducin family protein n=1 Tax=Streptomyces griseicoloratus TaxID=2752516 RepID=UPI002811954C|nr:class II aldolase/adducin family protein [Streptomyces griseicoloratus]